MRDDPVKPYTIDEHERATQRHDPLLARPQRFVHDQLCQQQRQALSQVRDLAA